MNVDVRGFKSKPTRQHWNFMTKGEGKGEGKGKGRRKTNSSSTSVCWSCGKTGHFASNCPNYRVSAVEGEELYRRRTQEIGLTLVSTIGQSGPIGRSTRQQNFATTLAVGIRRGMINFYLGTLGPGILRGILGVGLRTLLQTKRRGNFARVGCDGARSTRTFSPNGQVESQDELQPEHFAHVGCCSRQLWFGEHFQR